MDSWARTRQQVYLDNLAEMNKRRVMESVSSVSSAMMRLAKAAYLLLTSLVQLD